MKGRNSMKKKVLFLLVVSCFIIQTSFSYGADSRVIYDFTQLTEDSGEIILQWNNDKIKDNIQMISYYLTNDNVLEVTYRTGNNIPSGFNKRIIKGINFPIRTILIEQKVELDKLSDLPKNKIDKYDILNLYDRGIVNGYKGQFYPSNNVRRAEFFAMIASTAGYEIDDTSKSVFSDVDDNFWGRKYIMTLYNKGVLSGNGKGLCNPNGFITIGEVLAVIDRIFTFQDQSADYKKPVKNHFSNNNYITLVKSSIIKQNDKYYYPYTPNVKATKQQCATLLSRVLLNNYKVKMRN
jgi:hypothetical protein